MTIFVIAATLEGILNKVEQKKPIELPVRVSKVTIKAKIENKLLKLIK